MLNSRHSHLHHSQDLNLAIIIHNSHNQVEKSTTIQRIILSNHSKRIRNIFIEKFSSLKIHVLKTFFFLLWFVVGPQGPPSFNAAPTLTPGFNQQPQFGQPTASSLPPVGINANVPASSGGGFGPPSPTGYPAASPSTPSKGFVNQFKKKIETKNMGEIIEFGLWIWKTNQS